MARKNLKKALAVTLSMAMAFSMSAPVFATDLNTPEAETDVSYGESDVTANILAHHVESYRVPSSIKVALNPGKFDVTKDNKGTENDATDDVIVDDEIVSMSYGIANLSNLDMDVNVSFSVSYNSVAEKEPIVFVDTKEEVANAEKGELKLYLAAVASTAKPQVDESTPFVEEPVTNDVYDPAKDNATAANLANVSMTKATTGDSVFKKNAEGTAVKTDIAYKLAKAEYTKKPTETIDFTTTQAQLPSKLSMTKLGDVVGFTFDGDMNDNADWTKADTTSIKITPVYEFTEATDEEEYVDSENDGASPYHQIVAGAGTVTYALELNSTNGNLSYTFDGNAPEGSLTTVSVTVDGTTNTREGQIRQGNITYSDGKFRITAAGVTACGIETGKTRVEATIGESVYTFTY